MDIGEGKFYASCSRLKTKRRKKRLQRKDKDKQLIQLYKKLEQIRKEQNSLGYTDLIPPVQKGWKRFFVLHTDLARLDDALFFQQLLNKINITQFSFRRDFKIKQKRKGKKVYVDRDQPLPEIELYQLRRLNFTEKEQMYFNYEPRYDKNHWRAPRMVLIFNEPWRFVLKVEPNMITQVRIIDPCLNQQEQEIKNHLVNNNLWVKMCKLIDGYYSNKRDRWKRVDKIKYRNLFKTESLSKLLERENEH